MNRDDMPDEQRGLIFDTVPNLFYYHDGTEWKLCDKQPVLPSISEPTPVAVTEGITSYTGSWIYELEPSLEINPGLFPEQPKVRNSVRFETDLSSGSSEIEIVGE